MAAATLKWIGVTSGDYSVITNWESLTGGEAARVPASLDSVIIPADATVAIDAGLGQSAVLLVNFTKEPGCTIAIASSAAPLEINADVTTIAGTGVNFLDIDGPGEVFVDNSGSAGVGSYGTHLAGGVACALLTIACDSGQSVGLGALAGTVASFTEIRIIGGDVVLGAGLTTTTVVVTGGDVETRCAMTTQTVKGGIVRIAAGTVTTLNCAGGRAYLNGAIAPTNVNISAGGVVDASEDARSKTIAVTDLTRPCTLHDPYGVLILTDVTRAVGGTLSLS